MAGEFDAFYQWLGILPKEQPPNHYRLLGVALFEADSDVISNAVDQRMALLRTFQIGDHALDSQRLIHEVAVAMSVLLNHELKAHYDAQTLQRSSATGASGRQAIGHYPAPSHSVGAPCTAIRVCAGHQCVGGLCF